ncbi:membrane-spanning 4-domains subfamily A member 4A-like [Heterodontus francisci]|uniref:membrane-spanning 4-domains subfamily A member 4A-like n=1 Tax=Heterodontus francisci TaxID=7792 RepID=UPI00355C8A3C
MAALFNHEGTIVTTFTSPATQASNRNTTPIELDSRQFQQIPRHIQKFLKGEHKALGVVQIMLGIIQVTFGFALYYINPTIGFIGTPWWTGALYITSGALSVSVAKRPKKSLVVGGLVMNILSTIAAGLGILLYSVFLLIHPWLSGFQCVRAMDVFHTLIACLLMFTILEFAISITASVFNCQGLQCCEPDYELNAIVTQTATAQNYEAQEPQDFNYETLLADRSDYDTLTFK